MKVDGSVALVTGGASGLGLATVRRLLGAGASVVLADLPSSDGEAVAAALGDRAVFVPTDVTSEADVAAAVDTAAGLGDLRIVVNCAGVGIPGRERERDRLLPLAGFDRIIQVNLIGTFNVIRLAAEQMAAQEPQDPEGEERGVIVDAASVAAFEGQVGEAAYPASEGNVAGLPRLVARDLAGFGIRVTALVPALYEGPTLPLEFDRARTSPGARPLRPAHPAEVAALVQRFTENRTVRPMS
ncbi:SDR family NAD(P)-dependent oxidoreductase [Streptomyces canus]|uniref:SDR family NAD(P)-dependent oxidoreductase n=1 Tax=Streptomyces canus TaxID=58343 RepID=UPI002E31CA5D|nr:SDR family NAD(P)-dependent oxidoreductase [Streptomyces canus]